VRLLIDSCVWSLALRRRHGAILSAAEQQIAASLTEAIRDGRAAIIGPIRQEILSGIKDPTQFEKLRRTLQSFPDESVATSDYEDAGRLFNVCRSKGLQCGPVDILLCAVALQRRWAILTFDQGLRSCMELVMGDLI
jgi:predicted nucleic acid-binding protein